VNTYTQEQKNNNELRLVKDRLSNNKEKFERLTMNMQSLKCEMTVLSKKLELADPS